MLLTSVGVRGGRRCSEPSGAIRRCATRRVMVGSTQKRLVANLKAGIKAFISSEARHEPGMLLSNAADAI
jgi:hypothetical protein